MAIKLPELAPIDYTSLDFDSIIELVDTLVREHPDYFTNVDDFLQSNAGKFVVELVAYVVDLLANRIDWVANEVFLPTATQKQNVINLLKLINYRLTLPRTAAVTVTASISRWVNPFVIPPRYSVPAKDLDGNNINFELLQKDTDGKYVYEGLGSNYEFDTSFEIAPVLSHNDLLFYQGNSYQEFYRMQGVNNEIVQLGRIGIEEGSIRAWKITRDINGSIITRRELTQTNSFISPEAQDTSLAGLPPFKVQITQNNGAFLIFGESPVVAIFAQTGTEEIMTWYRVTKGSLGNITANSVNYTTTIVAGGENVQVGFLNSSAGSGGTESETIDQAKRYGPLTITTVEKTVNPDDFVILLENFASILNAIAYGKSNEPPLVFTDYGYRIPPYETWIYTVYNKTGWESFPTYSYPMEMKIGRPYVRYGLIDHENIKFISGVEEQVLMKLKFYALSEDTSNIKVTDTTNSTIYILGDDFVIDLDGRTITRIDGGAILAESIVKVQYYQNDKMDEDYILINFATSDEQDIPRTPIYPGIRTSAVLSDFSVNLLENTLSSNDWNWPENDYYIDYENGKIIKNSVYPYLDSKTNFGATQSLLSGVNNEFIINFQGLNSPPYNSDHDFELSVFNGWASVGNGLSIIYTAATYSFRIEIDGGGAREYAFTMFSGGIWTPAQLAEEIWTNAIDLATSDPFAISGLVVFADSFRLPTSPPLTFMSLTEGPTSDVSLLSGATYTNLFSFSANLDLNLNYSTGTGENIDVIQLADRCRFTLNALGLCNGFVGQDLPAGNEEKPEIFSKTEIINPSMFIMTGLNDTLTFNLTGTGGTTYDGSTQVTFNTIVANSPYDLTTWQGRLDLIRDMQLDIDGVSGYNQQDIIEIFWIRQPGTHYRIGFRQIDTAGSNPSIKMENDTGRVLFQFSPDQSSIDENLVIARVSPSSDMVGNYYLRIEVKGAFGPTAFIQAKANNALHNNTLTFLGYGDNQYRYGTQILQRTIIPVDILIADGTLKYTFYNSGGSQNNKLDFDITSPPLGIAGDGDYVITIPAGNYNITQLISVINTAFETADFSGTTYDISDFMLCEKVEGLEMIRFIMIDFDSTATDPPNFIISDNNDAAINTRCANKLGFNIGQSAATYSTIILSYAGEWNSDFESDASEEATVLKYLKDKRLISQDYIIKDPMFTSFDFKATVYVSKGFDRDLIKGQVESSVFTNFKINNLEFAEPVAASNILKLISAVEGIEYTTIDYFGRDYQLYRDYIMLPKSAIIRSSTDKKAESISSRWNLKSAFVLTLDGTIDENVNNDGEYLILIGNNWTSGNYDSLLTTIQNGTGGVGGLAQAIPLQLGKNIVNLLASIHVRHYDGVFEFYSDNEGPIVSVKIANPENIQLRGYQALARVTPVLDSEYIASTTYSLRVNIDGGSLINYEITSPTSGTWTLATIASQLENVLPSSAIAGIDASGYIRISSLLGGYQSTIVLASGTTGQNLLTLLSGALTAVQGSTGYTPCLGDVSGSLGMDPVESRGIETLPRAPEDGGFDLFVNYKTTILADYDEILFLNDNSFIGGASDIVSQRHGLIIEYVESGRA